MKKKIKLCLIFTLILQLLIPSYLLINHYTCEKKALESEKEYLFLLSDITFFTDRRGSITECESFHFFIDQAYNFYNSKIAVTETDNGIAVLEEKTTGTDIWFDYNHYKKKQDIYSDSFTFENDSAILDTIREIETEYSSKWSYSDFEEIIQPETQEKKAFISAKVYKGIFIPTAVYFGTQKILTIEPDI